MTDYNVSVVLLIPDEHRASINEYAETLGWGSNNLSVELHDADGAVWWGCHTRELLVDLTIPPDGSEHAAALAALVTSVVADGDPVAHWSATLSEYGLTRPHTGDRP